MSLADHNSNGVPSRRCAASQPRKSNASIYCINTCEYFEIVKKSKMDPARTSLPTCKVHGFCAAMHEGLARLRLTAKSAAHYESFRSRGKNLSIFDSGG
jgi:hypothetical protein